jgi:hypothetical protein
MNTVLEDAGFFRENDSPVVAPNLRSYPRREPSSLSTVAAQWRMRGSVGKLQKNSLMPNTAAEIRARLAELGKWQVKQI